MVCFQLCLSYFNMTASWCTKQCPCINDFPGCCGRTWLARSDPWSQLHRTRLGWTWTPTDSEALLPNISTRPPSPWMSTVWICIAFQVAPQLRHVSEVSNVHGSISDTLNSLFFRNHISIPLHCLEHCDWHLMCLCVCLTSIMITHLQVIHDQCGNTFYSCSLIT